MNAETSPVIGQMPTGRDGHLSDLDLELLLDDPTLPVATHVTECAACRGRLQALRHADAGMGDLPILREAPQIPLPANRPWWMVLGGAAIAAAAAMLVIPAQTVGPDDFRSKGAAMDLEVFVHDGNEVQHVRTDDVVHPGERLGFRITPRHDGYVMLVGFDGVGPYPCWPQHEGASAEWFEASGTAIDLEAAVRLDDRLGDERIVAVLCEEPFGFEDAVDEVLDGPAGGGCVSDEVTLSKVAP